MTKIKILPETAKLIGEIVEQSLLAGFIIDEFDDMDNRIDIRWFTSGTGTITLSIKYDKVSGELYFTDFESLMQDSVKVDSTITPELVINFINKWKDHI